jgi:hypothetical protein
VNDIKMGQNARYGNELDSHLGFRKSRYRDSDGISILKGGILG